VFGRACLSGFSLIDGVGLKHGQEEPLDAVDPGRPRAIEDRRMSTNRIATLTGALVFLCLAGLALYRLLFGFRITIGGEEVGQTSSFFAFVICAALSLILFRGGRARLD